MSTNMKKLLQQKKNTAQKSGVTGKEKGEEEIKSKANLLKGNLQDSDDEDQVELQQQGAKDLKQFKKEQNVQKQTKKQQQASENAQIDPNSKGVLGWNENEHIVVDHSINVPEVKIQQKKDEEHQVGKKKELTMSEKIKLRMQGKDEELDAQKQIAHIEEEEFPEIGGEIVQKPKTQKKQEKNEEQSGKKPPMFTNSKKDQQEKKNYKPINTINDDSVEAVMDQQKIKFGGGQFKLEGKKDQEGKNIKALELSEQEKKQLEAEKRLEEKFTTNQQEQSESKPKTFINKAKKPVQTTEQTQNEEQPQQTNTQKQSQETQQQQVENQFQSQDSELKKPKFVNSKKKAEDIIKQNNTKLEVALTQEQVLAEKLAQEKQERMKQKEEKKKQFKNNNKQQEDDDDNDDANNNNQESNENNNKSNKFIQRKRPSKQNNNNNDDNNNQNEEPQEKPQKSHQQGKNEFKEVTKKNQKQNKEKKENKQQKQETVVEQQQNEEQVESPKKKVVKVTTKLVTWD